MEATRKGHNVAARHGAELCKIAVAKVRRQGDDVAARHFGQLSEFAGKSLHLDRDQAMGLGMYERGRDLTARSCDESRRRAQRKRHLGSRRQGRIRDRELI